MPAPVLLLSCYELEHPPLSLAWPLAFLREAGIDAEAVDLSVEPLAEQRLAAARLIVIAVPMHTALRLAVEVAARVRRLRPEAHVACIGLYAWLNAEYLLEGVADSVLAGEAEPALLELARALLAGSACEGLPGVRTRRSAARPLLSRPRYPVPERQGLPGLERYARLMRDGQALLAGYTEASRGCRHRCRHCPVVPVYDGRFVAVPVDVVLQDVTRQVAAGARHISFGDPDFLNGPGHALRVARALHAAFPQLSFDFTAKVEHVVRHAALLPELGRLGCAFVVSAVESLSAVVLARLAKGHTRADVETAIRELDCAGIALHATLIPFTPWATLHDYLELLEFFDSRHDRVHVPPVQLSLRLLVPPGSVLLDEPETRTWLGPLQPEDFAYRWRHPDPRMDELQRSVAATVEQAVARQEPEALAWARIRELAWRASGTGRQHQASPWPKREPPRLTAHWFC